MANGDPAVNTASKWIVTLVGLLGTAIGSVGTSYLSTNEISSQVQVLTERVANLQARIETGMDDRWRGADARAAHDAIAERDASMLRLIDKNAKQIAELENIVRGHVSERGSHN